jgi:hypothetical protein
MSLRDINIIIKEEDARRQKYQHQQQQKEISAEAYKLFSEKKSPIEVAVTLSLREPAATKLFTEYCKLKRLHILISIYKETNSELESFLVIYTKLIKEKGMSVKKVVKTVDIAGDKLPYLENLYGQAKEQVDNMQRTIQHLSNDIHALEYKISLLNKTSFSSE